MRYSQDWKSRGEKMAELMKITGLKKRYDNNSGITDIRMNISKGTIHGFLGLNGSGKTTTMKIIMGLLRKDGGMIEYDGREYDPANVNDRANIGFSPDLPFYPPYLTGEELVAVYGHMRGLTKSESKKAAEDLLKMVELYDHRNKKVGKYSRGMLARVGIAVSLIGDPGMIILDEPTSGLDPAATSTVRNLLGKLRKDGKTVLLSSHLLGEVQNMCQNITIIHAGSTIMEGSMNDLIEKFSNDQRYVAEFSKISPTIVSEIRKVEGINKVQVIDTEGRPMKLTFYANSDIRENVAMIAVKNGSMMISCTPEGQSLEELFLKLVGNRDDKLP